MDFFNQIGKIALGSRLRRLSEHMTDNAAEVFKMYGIEMKPKWFPVYYSLANGEEKAVTQLASEIGHSHPFISKIIQEMAKAGLIIEKKDRADGRKSIVKLSAKATPISEKIRDTYADVNAVLEEILGETRHNLWKAIDEWEHVLQQRPYLKRVVEHRKKRESQYVTVVDYQPKYRKAFKELNEAWIRKYFKMEQPDHDALDNPKKTILARGGHIIVALYKGEPVGVCALAKSHDPEYDFEVVKMAVAPEAQGKNIGWLLGHHIIEKARSLGARKLFLESNTVLGPAINLYYKLGFKRIVPKHISPYERSNIQMELPL